MDENFLKTHEKMINKWLCIVAFAIYLIYTIKMTFLSGHIGWEDEGHFWTITKYCSIPQIFSLMKVEGHMMLWYLIVMPFAKLNSPYPYAMQILNWSFCTGALVLMWKKAPFNPFVKAAIVLCPVFLNLYSILARCYSLTFFLLFCACAFYTERLKRPYLYFLILVLAANSCVQGLIGATALGIPFLYELYKEHFIKKASIVPALVVTGITALIGIMLYFQLVGAAIPDYETEKDGWFLVNSLTGFLSISSGVSVAVSQLQIVWIKMFIIVLMVLFLQKPKAFFVWLFSFGICTLFFSVVYSPRTWHLAFYVIYLIMVFWVFENEKPDAKSHNVMQIVALIAFVALMPLRINFPHCRDFIGSVIVTDEVLSQGKIFTDIYPILMGPMLPRFNEKGVYIYDMSNRNLSYYEGLRKYYDGEARKFTVSEFKDYIEKDGKRYFLLTLNKDMKIYDKINSKLYKKYVNVDVNFWIYEIFPD